MARLSRRQYYFRVVEAVALRGSCDRGRSGAVIVKEGRIISAGYVGSPASVPHCDDVGHKIEVRRIQVDCENWTQSEHCVRTVHAELNAILQAARYGVPIEGSELYSTMFPCYDCAKAIINVGILEVHAIWDYQRSRLSKELFDLVKIPWTLESEEIKSYETNSREI